MPRIPSPTIDFWKDMAENWLAPQGYTAQDVKTGRDAWTIAQRSGITQEAYRDRDICDAHIQTALGKIFPNAIFQDKKVY